MNAYHRCTPALPNPIPAYTLAKCMAERASKSSASNADLQGCVRVCMNTAIHIVMLSPFEISGNDS